jgi:hypothetical protein
VPFEDLLIDHPNLAPLALLDTFVDEKGDIWVDSGNWTTADPGTFRKYMFGTWKGYVWLNHDICPETFERTQREYFVFDDSEKGFPINIRHAYGYYQHNDTIILAYSDHQADSTLLWLDINNPDVLYHGFVAWGQGRFAGPAINADTDFSKINTTTLPRIETTINPPENGYMSRLRLYEIAKHHNIDLALLFHIEYIVYNNDETFKEAFSLRADYTTYPIYLISETPDKFVFKSFITSNAYYYRHLDDGNINIIQVTYTIEKINGKWVRTVELDTELNSEESSFSPDFSHFGLR